MNKVTSVFISYTTEANDRAQQIKNYLRKYQVDAFTFETDLEVLKHPGKGIRAEIFNSSIFILVLSKKSKESNWVSFELGVATGLQKSIYIFKTAAKLTLPDFISEYNSNVVNKVEDLKSEFGLKKIDKRMKKNVL